MYLSDIIIEALNEPLAASAYTVSRRLAQIFPGRAIVESDDWDFRLAEFARAGCCSLLSDETIHGQVVLVWDNDKGIISEPRNIWYEVDWEGDALDVLMMHLENGCSRHYWILAESEDLARRFFKTVCAWNPELRDEMLVYDGGRWDQNSSLHKAIQGSTFDNLVLRGGLKEAIHADLERFFASRETYQSLGVPWKRGILLTGPPGNGKTHTIKALVNRLGKPCLYAKSFRSEQRLEETNIRLIFQKARRASPCLLVLEDLDSLVTEQNRSFVLNEIDGFALNQGIAIVATTNHPEKLDPAIVERPSRFDRKYQFDRPGAPERAEYTRQWSRSLPENLQLDDEGIDEIVALTHGFSFAHLKELFLSSIMARAAVDDMTMRQIITDHARTLGEQIRRPKERKGTRRPKRNRDKEATATE
jgi:AAA+ superfamily predicted ATPase